MGATKKGRKIADEKIRELITSERKKNGLSYEKLGEKLGVSASYLFRLEKGDRSNPSSEVLAKFCELFDVDPRSLLDMPSLGMMVDGNLMEMDDIQELLDFMLSMNVENMRDVTSLLARINKLQNQIQSK